MRRNFFFFLTRHNNDAVEGVWEALTFNFPNDRVSTPSSYSSCRKVSPLTSHTRVSEKKVEPSKVVKKVYRKITLEDVPKKFRYRFKVKGMQVLCGVGGWWLLENGSKGRAKDLEVDYDEGLFGEVRTKWGFFVLFVGFFLLTPGFLYSWD